MSCNNPTGPIDIQKYKNTYNCVEKCNLTYQYNISSVIAKNRKFYISLKTNNTKYVVNYSTADMKESKCSNSGGEFALIETKIYYPSLHTYNGKRAPGEIIIYHENLDGGNDLIICIPISINQGNLPNAASQLTSILNYLKSLGINNGEGGNVQGLNFNLNQFIPKNKGFYGYTATLPYVPCTNCIDYVVYDLNEVSVGLSEDSFNTLKSLIEEKKTLMQKFSDNLGYKYNKIGAISKKKGEDDNIYIDCQPTGSNGEILIEEKKNTLLSSGFNFSSDKFLENTWIISIILGLLLVLIIYYVFRHILKGIFNFDGSNFKGKSFLKN